LVGVSIKRFLEVSLPSDFLSSGEREREWRDYRNWRGKEVI